MKITWLACIAFIAGACSTASEPEPQPAGGTTGGMSAAPVDNAAGQGGMGGVGGGGTGGDAPPVSGTTGGAPPVGGSDAGVVNPMGMEEPTPDGGIPYAMDECDINSGYPGDEYCILPPPVGEGFQLHIGPDDYDNIDPQYILAAEDESTDNFTDISGNTENIHFLFRQFRMRPGSHHMIVTAGGTPGTGGNEGFGGRRIATANLSQDSPPGGIIAPENEGVGIPLAPSSSLNVSLHTVNITEQPILREIWVNFWYRDPSKVTEEATQLFQTGDVTFSVGPGETQILGPYSCNVNGGGRMLWFYGHRHANNTRFSAWRVRGGQRDLFYEGLHWEEPLLLEYNTLTTNPLPDRAKRIEGGWTGVLDLAPGDKLEWECDVTNNNPAPITFSNETYTGEMCIMDAELVGSTCTGGFGI
jgi:hypothetical protein